MGKEAHSVESADYSVPSPMRQPETARGALLAHLNRDDGRNLLLLLGVFLLVLFLIPPQHEYAVLDDSIYADTARTLHETGRFVMPGLNQSNLIAMVLWGVLWTTLFGFSFTTLTYSTLFMAALALVCFYAIARAVDVPSGGALLGTMLLGFNPLFLHLSYTFMTDVPFVALMLASSFLYIRGLQSRRLGWLVAGGFFAGWAYLIRQFGIFIPICFLLYLGFDFLKTREWRWREALAIVALPVLAFGGWHIFRAWQSIGPTGAELHAERHAARFRWKLEWVRVVGLRVANAAPLIALFAWAAVKLPRARLWLVPVCLATLVGSMYLLDLPEEEWIPITEQPFVANVGPRQIIFPQEAFTFGTRGSILRVGGIDFFQYQQEPVWSQAAWRGLWAVGVLLAAILFARMIASLFDWGGGLLHERQVTPLAPFYLLGFAIFAISIAYPNEYFDRYVLGFLPFVILFLVRGARGWGKVAWAYSTVALMLLALFSLLLKSDMASHASARWQAAEWMVARTGKVHGGFDWDNWTRRGDKDRNYQISDLPTPGYRTEHRFPYTSLLSGGETRYVLAEARASMPPVEP